jgi:hypothetical protein
MDLHGLCLEIGKSDSGSRHPKIAFFVSPSQAPHITSVIYDLPIPYVVRYSLTGMIYGSPVLEMNDLLIAPRKSSGGIQGT